MAGGDNPMSLKDMLTAHDENALIALSSKGLVRRASREASKGDTKIVDIGTSSAEMEIDDQTIKISDKGPRNASCTCPATGLCRHILTAVIVLRKGTLEATVGVETEAATTTAPSPKTETEKAEKPKSKTLKPTKTLKSAREEIEGLTEAAIKKFAGADFQAALQLAASVESPDIVEDGLNITLSIPDSPASVTFIAGQGLKGAVYKGRTTKSRLITATSAILIRRLSGISINEIIEEDVVDTATVQKEMDKISKVIEDSVRAVLTGVPAIAADQLFDKAIAARVQTMPRLTAQLRALAKQAMLATSRHIDFEPTAFLEASADCYALCEAIKYAPQDYKLTGSLRRDYKVHNPMDLWMLGARAWRSTAGARGLTSYGFCTLSGQWFETTTARAAGMDLSFSPRMAYEGGIWKTGTLRKLMGQQVHLPSPKISSDNQISQMSDKPGTISKSKLTLDILETSNAVETNWQSLRDTISNRSGMGLSRLAYPIVSLIKPDKHLDISFDEMEQCYKWGVVDNHNEVLFLNIPAGDQDIVKKLQSIRKKTSLILIVSRFKGFDLVYEPVSLLLNYKNQLTVLNIQLDNIEYRTLLGRVSPKLSDFFPQFTPATSLDLGGGTKVLDNALDVLLDVSTSPARKARLKNIISKCEQAGFLSLAKVIAPLENKLSQNQILKAVFLINQIRFLMSLNKQSKTV
jgi:hypothetical protein